MNGLTCAGECRDNILRGALQQCHNVCENFCLALDCAKCLEVLSTHIHAFFCIGCLQSGDSRFLTGFLDQLRGSVSHIAEENGRRAFQHITESAEIVLSSFESLLEERVLHHYHLDTALEALTTKIARLASIQTGHIYEVEVCVFFQLFTESFDDEGFIFLSHDDNLLFCSFFDGFGINFDTLAHCGRKINTLDIGTLGSSRLQLDDCAEELAGIAGHLFSVERHLTDGGVYDTGFVDLEVDLTRFHFANGLGNIHRHRTALGVRHETTGAEYASERTDLTHDGRHRDDHIDVGPTALDFVDIFVETYIVGSGFLRGSFLIGGAEAEHTHHLTGSVGKGYNAAYHLVGLTGVNTETYVDVERSVELGRGDFFHQRASFCKRISLTCFNLSGYQLLILRKFTHCSKIESVTIKQGSLP